MRIRTPLPALEGATTWVNGEPNSSDLQGKVLLVHFWSVSCYICHNVVDQVNGWRETYGPQGLQMISVHQPRSPEELDIEAVTKDLHDNMGITQPCAIDNAHTIVGRFANEYVPAYYVFGKTGELRHFQAGDKGYERIVKAIERCLGES